MNEANFTDYIECPGHFHYKLWGNEENIFDCDYLAVG